MITSFTTFPLKVLFFNIVPPHSSVKKSYNMLPSPYMSNNSPGLYVGHDSAAHIARKAPRQIPPIAGLCHLSQLPKKTTNEYWNSDTSRGINLPPLQVIQRKKSDLMGSAKRNRNLFM
jgi:hypothetical protein